MGGYDDDLEDAMTVRYSMAEVSDWLKDDAPGALVDEPEPSMPTFPPPSAIVPLDATPAPAQAASRIADEPSWTQRDSLVPSRASLLGQREITEEEDAPSNRLVWLLAGASVLLATGVLAAVYLTM